MLQDLQKAPFRPFFLLAALSAVAGGLVWWWAPASLMLRLHLDLMLFGLGGAAMAGYLLTALIGWTGQPHCPPAVLWGLVLGWSLSRLVVPGFWPDALWWLPLLGFHGGLAGWLTTEVVRARAWPRLPLALAPLGIGLAQGLLWVEWRWSAVSGHWTAVAFALLLVLVGGRLVPAFTHSALQARGLPHRLFDPARVQGVSLALLVGVLVLSWPPVAGPVGSSASSGLLIGAGLLQWLRLFGWRCDRAWRLPAVWMLQAAWAWLGVGLLLLGFARLGLWPPSAGLALHALTMGGMGGMILGVMLRAGMRRTAIVLVPTPAQHLAAALVLLSPLPRLLDLPLWLAAVLWCLGWLLTLYSLWPALRGPAPKPVFSGPKPR